MPDICDLPFELSEESVSAWLLSLERLSLAEKLKRTTKLIAELGNPLLEAELLFPVVDKLTETVLMLSKLLEKFAAGEKKSSGSGSTKKFTYYAVQLPQKLCFIYDRLSQDKTLPAASQAVCLYRALQLLCLLIKRNTLFYEAPDLSLWKKLPELYFRAKTQNFLTTAIDDQVAGLVRQPTIEAVLKHSLLFYLCHPYHCTASEIAGIFSAVGDLAPMLRLTCEPSESAYYWNPYLREPPRIVPVAGNPEQRIYLDTSDIIEFLESSVDKPERYQALAPVFDRLMAYYEIRRSVDPAGQTQGGLILGISRALKFLNILTSRYQILELTGTLKDKYHKSRLELMPKDNEEDALAFLSTEIIKDEAGLSVVNIKTYRTKSLYFRTAKIGHVDYSADTPTILVYENQRPLLGIIRHIRTDEGIKLKNILLEIIDGAVYPIETEDTQGILVIRPSGESELFLPPGPLLANDVVLSKAKNILNQTFRVEKFIELTSHFSRYRIAGCDRID
ncbi:MAG: hypothetical protein ACU83O_08345 [Gammaproteobacteria bacterium]